jgi:hypothetical protein
MENEKDLVKRLRWLSTNVHSDSAVIGPFERAVIEAADEIERLRHSLQDCQRVRDSWCFEYAKLRDYAMPLKKVAP